MLYIDKENNRFEILLGGNATTNQLSFIVFYLDRLAVNNLQSQTYGGKTNNTVAVNLLPTLASKERYRSIEEISIVNEDTVSANVIIRINIGINYHVLINVAIEPAEMIQYKKEKGWVVLTSIGEIKTGGSGLTNIELRASPIPVTGTISVNTSLLATEATLSGLATAIDNKLRLTPISVDTELTDVATETTLNTLLKPGDTLTKVTTLDTITNPVTVDATNLDTRDLTFATDKVDTSGSVVALDAPTLAALENITVSLDTSTLATSAKQDLLLTELQLKADITETQPVSVATLPLPSGAATAANQQTDALTNTQLRATPVPISGTVAVTGAGDASASNQTALNTLTGAVTEVAPAGDTASSGLNGRLQRIAQRITSLITALGSPFQAGGSIGNTAFGVNNASGASAVNIQDGGNSITVDGTVTANISGSISNTSFATTQATAANLNATVVGTGTFVTQSTLAAETTKVIGTVNISAAQAVTSNAGTNLNTSLLSLETTQNAIKTAVELIDNAITGNEMQVDIVASLPAGTNNIGDVDVLSLPSLPTGANTIGAVNIAASQTIAVTQATPSNLQATATPIAITKGTQGPTGFTVQALKDAGRNTRNFMLDAYTVAPAIEAVQSVVQWFGNAAVVGTTQPAVVTTGKTLRLTNYTITTKSLATVGSAVVRIRANTAGLGVLASPLVFSMEAGSKSGATTVAMTGGLGTFSGVFPEGLEFPAGTGLAFSMAGYGPTGALAVQGVTRFQVFGYEY